MMSAKRRASQIDDHTSSRNHDSVTKNKIRRVDEAAPAQMQSNMTGGTGGGGGDAAPPVTTATPQPTQNQLLPRVPEFALPSHPNGDQQNRLQNQQAVQLLPQPQPWQPLQSSQSYGSTRAGINPATAQFENFYKILESYPLDTSGLLVWGPTQQVFVSTFRPQSLHLSLYSTWINGAIEMMSFPSTQLRKLFISLSSWCELDVSSNAPAPPAPVVKRVAWPERIHLPLIQLGHIFSTSMFGNDNDVPLYYIQIVRGQSDAVKVAIHSSKRELVSALYYEAKCGYSTVLICGICQSVPGILGSLDLSQDRLAPPVINQGHTASQAQELLERADKKIAIIC